MNESLMISKEFKVGGERRQFVRALLPMTVAIDGRYFKGHDLSLGGMCLVDVHAPVSREELARVAVDRRDTRVEFVIDTVSVDYDPADKVQRFKFMALSKVQAGIISLLVHHEER